MIGRGVFDREFPPLPGLAHGPAAALDAAVSLRFGAGGVIKGERPLAVRADRFLNGQRNFSVTMDWLTVR
jgi:hypothetical protein